MKIVIDARTVTGVKTGVGNYIVSLTQALRELDTNHTYLLDRAKWRHKLKKIRGLSTIARLFYLFTDNFIYPLRLLIRKPNIYHNPAFILPFLNFRYKKVITIHDLGFYVFGDKFAKGWHGLHMRFMLPYSVRQADRIIAVSGATKKQIMDIFKVPPEKITVTYEGVSEKFRVIQDTGEIEKVLAKYGIKKPYILFVGTMDPRKNLSRLIEAFTLVKKDIKNLRLLIVGGKGELFSAQMEKMIKTPDIISTGYVPDEDMVYIYNACDVFAFPSLYEGFGLPILEAMACGAPVVTSNVYSMPEVAGDAAILVNPEKVEEIKTAIVKLLMDTILRKQMVDKGLERVKEFTWRKTAATTLAVYEEVMK